MKPKIFIGSSVEGLAVAKAVQTNLDHYAHTEIWSQIDFKLSFTALDSLIENAKKSDFAIFVFGLDDSLKIRESEVKAVRDNVLFELGLFMGAISRDRVFFIKPRNEELHIPSDLWGITAGDYDSNHHNITAAVGVFCTKVEKLIKELFVCEFPETGRWGTNLLAETTKTIVDGKQYCLNAIIPRGAKLELRFFYSEPQAIAFSMSERKGFYMLNRDNIGIKAMDLSEPLGDCLLLVNPNYDLVIEAYINGSLLFKKEFSNLI